jgi:hypothetical protein
MCCWMTVKKIEKTLASFGAFDTFMHQSGINFTLTGANNTIDTAGNTITVNSGSGFSGTGGVTYTGGGTVNVAAASTNTGGDDGHRRQHHLGIAGRRQ